MPVKDLPSSLEDLEIEDAYDFVDYILEEYYLRFDELIDISREGLSPEQYFLLRLPQDEYSARIEDEQPTGGAEPPIGSDLIDEGYGVRWTPISDPSKAACIEAAGPFAPEDEDLVCFNQVWVPYVDDDSAASQIATVIGGQPQTVPLQRGDSIQAINGVDVAAYRDADGNGWNDVLDLLFFGETELELTWVTRGRAGRTGIMPAPTRHQITALKTSIIDDHIGYININQLSTGIEDDLIRFIADQRNSIDELIIDLRYTIGGPLSTANKLAYMVAGKERTEGRNFSENRLNSKYQPCGFDSIYPDPEESAETAFETESRSGELLPELSLSRVFVLVQDDDNGYIPGTSGAAEAFISALRGIGFDTNVIGGRTAGENRALDRFTYDQVDYIIPVIEIFNDNGQTYSQGQFVSAPHCAVPSLEDIEALPLGNRDEDLLSVALEIINRELQECL